MNRGLFFGSFNPVHLGHVKVVSKILNEDIFDQLWIILSPKSPHKTTDLAKKNFRPKKNSVKNLNLRLSKRGSKQWLPILAKLQ